MRILLLIFLILSNLLFLKAQESIHIYSIDSDDYPTVSANLIVTDNNGDPVKPDINDLELTEFDLSRNILDIQCEEFVEVEKFSAVIVMDISGSMDGFSIEQAKQSARLLIDRFPVGRYECAISGFRDYSTIIQDFTDDKDQLVSKIDQIGISGGTDFNAALLGNKTGAYDILEKAQYRKVVFFLTDGYGYGNKSALIDEALRRNITVYTMTFTLDTHPILKDLSDISGGTFFGRIIDNNTAVNVLNQLYSIAVGIGSCRIKWETAGCYEDVVGNITFLPNGMSDNFYYHNDIYAGGSAKLDISPSNIMKFGAIDPGKKKDISLDLKALNQYVLIQDIISDFPDFQITDWGGSPPPFTIQLGQSRTIRITFTPLDSGMLKSRINILSNACVGNEIYAMGGFPGKYSDRSKIKVTHPDGGETFVAGTDTLITWKNTGPDDRVLLEFSSDGGNSWDEVSDNANRFVFNWSVPDKSSDRCLVKATELTQGDDVLKKLKIFNYPVYKVKFNDFGDKILAYDMNGVISLFDLEKDVSSQIINKQGDRILDIDWSYDNSRYAYSEWEVSVYNSVNGLEVSTFRDNDDLKRYYNIALTDKGDMFVTNLIDEEIVLVDANSGIATDTLVLFQNNPTFFDFVSPSEFITISSTGAFVRYSVASDSEIIRFNIPFNFIRSADFDRQSGKLAVLSQTNQILICDLDGNEINSFTTGSYSATSIALATYGLKVAVCTIGGKLLIYDVETGVLDTKIDVTTEKLNYVDWSSDGIKIALAAEDKYVYIYEYLGPVTSDISDNLFTIIQPEIFAEDINMGTLEVGDLRDSTVIDYIDNQTLFNVELDMITLSDNDNFSIISGTPYSIDAISKAPIGVAFHPDRVGLIESSIYLHFGSKVIEQKIYGIGFANKFDLSSKIVDMGKIKVGSTKDSLIKPLKLYGVEQIMIDSIRSYGPDLLQFKHDGLSDQLLLDEDFEIDITFEAIQTGRTSSIYSFYYDSPSSPEDLVVYAEGIDTIMGLEGEVRAYVENHKANIGEVITIPVNFSYDRNQIDPNTIISGELVFNNSLLVPFANTNPGMNNNGLRSIPFSSKLSLDFVQLTFRSTLGNAISTELILDNIKLSDPAIRHNTENGSFTLLDVCKEGGDRLIKDSGVFEISSIEPNPVQESANISFKVIEKGYHFLTISDVRGKVQFTEIIYLDKINTNQNIKIDISELGTGIYFLKIESPTGILFDKLIKR